MRSESDFGDAAFATMRLLTRECRNAVRTRCCFMHERPRNIAGERRK
jgi:hypothetical protein